MTKDTYTLIENYMKDCMRDCAHDPEHIYRVLYTALVIAETENNVDYDVLITACLLHDIGREDQLKNPTLCHAEVGSQKAFDFLKAHGFDIDFCEKVKRCVFTHRFRQSCPPESIEAKILFDADKIDVAGAIGIARTLIYGGTIGRPLYKPCELDETSDAADSDGPSFFREYKRKLQKVYSHFFTVKGAEIAKERQSVAIEYYNALKKEITTPYIVGKSYLQSKIDN